MDTELTLHELERLEAQRKLRDLPAAIVETAWVREAQIEAVIDAVLTVALGAEATAHARHAGEWCARIAAALPNGPDPSLARRVGVLGDIDSVRLGAHRRTASYCAARLRRAIAPDRERRARVRSVDLAR